MDDDAARENTLVSSANRRATMLNGGRSGHVDRRARTHGIVCLVNPAGQRGLQGCSRSHARHHGPRPCGELAEERGLATNPNIGEDSPSSGGQGGQPSGRGPSGADSTHSPIVRSGIRCVGTVRLLDMGRGLKRTVASLLVVIAIRMVNPRVRRFGSRFICRGTCFR